ncbi:MAG: hypothetical protein F4Y47_19165 [Acidobacteriia bacterium]|nr:hypothetical protein [Terriglobia bacterium]MYG02224.1 hypothetical protein [Terriglobia bacterium]MYK10304.1 hypothetical protein [Terriglobia bacterium]
MGRQGTHCDLRRAQKSPPATCAIRMTADSAMEVSESSRQRSKLWKRPSLHLLSRCVVCAVVAGSLGGLFFVPSNGWGYLADVLLRSYLAFVGTVMAHEAVHGLMGRTRAANLWWGRLALVPCMVPFTNFRKTHLLHHRFTNEESRDPDHFVKPDANREWELPLRAVAMPHHWLLWLRKREGVDGSHVRELLLNYLGIALVYLAIFLLLGLERMVSGMLPLLVIVSLLLWYPFAFKTHEGFSTGSPESRSHNYYGRLMYWFSFGLSMHRTHHLRPHLGWIELLPFVEPAPSTASALIPRRDIRNDRAPAVPDAQSRSQHA